MKRHPTTGAVVRARSLRRNMTDAERALWRILQARQIDGLKFRRQVPIGNFIGDFVCHTSRLIIEVDGGQHDPTDAGEMARTAFLRQEGYSVLRFWNNEVLANPDGVYHRIAEELRRHHPHPASPIKGEE